MQFGTSECLAHWARYRPNAPAVFHNGHICSFRELDSRVSLLATRLATEAARSHRTAIATRAKLDTFVAMLAAVRAGHSAVLINTGLPPATIETNLHDASPDVVVGDTSTASIAALVATSNWVLISDILESTASGVGSFPEAQGEQEWGVFFSSGTTGTPKAIERSHHSVITELIGWCLELSLNRQSAFYIGRPVFYTGGAVLSLATLLNGGASILNDVADESDFAAIWEDYQKVLASVPVTIAFFIPDQLRTFMRLAAGAVHSPLAADCILVMGGAISGAEKVEANRLLGSRIVESWGNSESLGTITEPEDLVSRPGSIGRPFLGDYMCIVDDDGRTLGPGELGHIAGGLEAGFNAYSNRPRETQQARRFDLIVSEDLGLVDSEGYFYVKGRIQESFILNDQTYFTSAIESDLRSDQDVLDCCVVAQPTHEGGVNMSALIVASKDARLPSLQEAVRERITASLGPTKPRVTTIIISAIPRLPSGKVDRVTAAQLAARKASDFSNPGGAGRD